MTAIDVDRLASLIVEHRFDTPDQESSEWGAWPSLWDRLASIHGSPGDSSRREAAAMLRYLIGLSSEYGSAGHESDDFSWEGAR